MALQACLRDAGPSGQAEDKSRSLIGCFRPRRQSKLASEEELEKAAQYVVARFGAFDNEDVSDEEEEGAEELEGKVTPPHFFAPSSSLSMTPVCMNPPSPRSSLSHTLAPPASAVFCMKLLGCSGTAVIQVVMQPCCHSCLLHSVTPFRMGNPLHQGYTHACTRASSCAECLFTWRSL